MPCPAGADRAAALGAEALAGFVFFLPVANAPAGWAADEAGTGSGAWQLKHCVFEAGFCQLQRGHCMETEILEAPGAVQQRPERG